MGEWFEYISIPGWSDGVERSKGRGNENKARSGFSSGTLRGPPHGDSPVPLFSQWSIRYNPFVFASLDILGTNTSYSLLQSLVVQLPRKGNIYPF